MNASSSGVLRIGTLSVKHFVPEQRSSNVPVLFVHGAWGGKWQFENWQRYTAHQGWESYALDLRGHGESPCENFPKASVNDYADDVLSLIKEIGPCYLLGHSMGGLVVQLAASRSNDVKKSMLLASSAPGKMFYINAYSLRMIAYAPGGLRRGTLMPKRSDIEKFFGHIPDEAADLFVPESMRACLEIVFNHVRARDIACPVLVVASERDRLIPLFIERKIARIYAAEYVELPDAGHFAMLEPHREATIERILEWLDRP